MLSADQRATLERWAIQVLPTATAFARSLVRDASLADDLVQECLFRLLRKAGEYDLPRDGVRLLFRSISNLCITQHSRRRELQSIDGESGTVADREAWTPDLLAQREELRQAIREALGELPELQRAAVELRSLGFENDQIAEVLQVSPSNAAVLLFRGRKHLLTLLSRFDIATKSDKT